MVSPALPRERTALRPASAPARNTVPEPAAPRPTPPPGARAARYRFDRRTGAWWWSPELFTVLGVCPDDSAPPTDVLLRQQHPDDRRRFLDALTSAGEDGRAFAVETRIVRPDGSRRSAVLVGEPSTDETGRIVAIDGICVDVTENRPPESERVRDLEAEVEQLRRAMASRACIEQAKGILMVLTNCGEQAAFDLLAHISSHTHRKVRDVAVQLTASASGGGRLPDDVRAILRDACPPASP